jgi:hypothetical protein
MVVQAPGITTVLGDVMRRLVLVMAAVLLIGGCATAAEREAARVASVAKASAPKSEACWARMEASPEYVALKDKLGGEDDTGLALQMNATKPTPEEAAQALVLHDQYVVPCRKLAAAAAYEANPSIGAAVLETFARQDALYAKLLRGEMTWGEYATQRIAVRQDGRAQIAAIQQRIQEQLGQSHAAESAQRAAAMQALG